MKFLKNPKQFTSLNCSIFMIRSVIFKVDFKLFLFPKIFDILIKIYSKLMQYNLNIQYVYLGNYTQLCLGLTLLALSTGITPGCAVGTTGGAGEQTQVSRVRARTITQCAISLSPGYSNIY